MPVVLNPDLPLYNLWWPLLRDEAEGGDKVLDVPNGKPDDGTKAQTWTPNGSPAQTFVLFPCGAGEYLIVNRWGRVLDCGVPPDQQIAWWGCHLQPFQRWRFEDSGITHPSKGTSLYLVRSLDGGRALDVANFSKKGGAAIVAWTEAHKGENQLVDIVSTKGEQFQP